MAIIDFFSKSEPSLAFPDISFIAECFDKCHPPVKKKEN